MTAKELKQEYRKVLVPHLRALRSYGDSARCEERCPCGGPADKAADYLWNQGINPNHATMEDWEDALSVLVDMGEVEP